MMSFLSKLTPRLGESDGDSKNLRRFVKFFFSFVLFVSLFLTTHSFVCASQTTIAIERPAYTLDYPTHPTSYYFIYTPISGQNGKYLRWPIYVSGTSTNDLGILYETEVRAFSGVDQSAGTYTGTWFVYTLAGSYGGDAKYSMTTNDFVEFSIPTVAGQTLSLIPYYSANAGYGYVTIDGQASAANLLSDDGLGNKYIDFYNSATTPSLYKNRRYSVPIADNLSAGTHTVRFTVAGVKNALSTGYRVFIDGIAVYNTNGTSADTIDGDFIIKDKTQITAGGDFEYAYDILESGVQTYFGTNTHGNDTLNTFAFNLDGTLKTLNNFDIFTGTNLNIAETSTMGDAVNPNVASVTRDYAFSSTGLDFSNTTTWNNPLPIYKSYWAMFPVLDGAATSTVGRFRGDNTVYALTVNDGSTLGNINTTKGYEYNSSNKRIFSMEITNLDSNVNNDQMMNIWDLAAPSYNKIYYYRQKSATLGSPYTPSVGEVWSSLNKYRYYYDNSAPTGISLSSPEDSSYTNDTTPTLSWTAGADAESEIDHYVVTVNGTDNTVAAGITTYTTGTLSDGSYTWLVKAYDYLGNYSTTSSRTFTVDTITQAAAPSCNDTSPSGIAPQLYEPGVVSNNSITLGFKNLQSPVDRFSLEYGTKSDSYQFGADNIGGVGTTSYTVRSLQPNTTYYFRVRAGNGCAVGTWSNEISAKTLGYSTTNSLKIIQSSLEPVPAPTNQTAESNTADNQVAEGYSLNVKVKDTKGEPVAGASVTIHSNIQTTTTDKDGIARFTGVEAGEHKVLIAYNNYQGEESINLTADNGTKEFNLNVTIQRQNILLSPQVLAIIGVSALVIAFLGFKLVRKNKIKKLK